MQRRKIGLFLVLIAMIFTIVLIASDRNANNLLTINVEIESAPRESTEIATAQPTMPTTEIDKEAEVMLELERLRDNLSRIQWSGKDFNGDWRDSVKMEKWKVYNLSRPTVILKFNIHVGSFGNMIGDYANAIAYADQVGMDFMFLKENEENPTDYPDKDELPLYLPWFIKSLRDNASEKNINIDACAGGYLHTCPDAFVLGAIPAVSHAIQEGCTKFSLNRGPKLSKELLKKSITIYMRCGDILKYVHHDEYGFLPYSVYSKYIPANFTGTIDIIGSPRKCMFESFCRHADIEKAKTCEILYGDLVSWISENYPFANVHLHENLTVGEAWFRMVYSGITICNPSTFCLWPTISSFNKAYLTRSRLFFGGGIQNLIGSNASWIENPKFLSPHAIITQNLDVKSCLNYLRTTPAG